MKNKAAVTGLEFQLDDHLKAVAEFMQTAIPASKLVHTAKALAKLADLLWSHYPQEDMVPASLLGNRLLSTLDATPQGATGYDPSRACADGGSVAEASAPGQ